MHGQRVTTPDGPGRIVAAFHGARMGTGAFRHRDRALIVELDSGQRKVFDVSVLAAEAPPGHPTPAGRRDRP